MFDDCFRYGKYKILGRLENLYPKGIKMNQFIKIILIATSAFLGSSFFGLANAKSPQPTPQAPLSAMTYSVTDLADAIALIESEHDSDAVHDAHPFGTCNVQRVVFATGIQSYESNGSQWNATGPLAELYDTDYLAPIGTDIVIDFAGGKIGTHYQSLGSPSWEFEDGRTTVDVSLGNKDVFKLAYSQGDVKWLNVALIDTVAGLNGEDIVGATDLLSLGYDRLYRVLTQGGVAPVFHGHNGKTVGMGYTTFYVFVTCP